MGVLTDLVIAPRAQAAALVGEASTPWARLDVKGHSSVTFGQLVAIVRGVEWSVEVFDDELVADGGEQGPWVTAVPDDFVADIAALADGRLDEVAAAWARTEELEGCSAADVRETLVALRAWCQRARAEGESMLMWMSL